MFHKFTLVNREQESVFYCLHVGGKTTAFRISWRTYFNATSPVFRRRAGLGDPVGEHNVLKAWRLLLQALALRAARAN